MSGATFADPEVLDWSAPSGTHTFALGTTTPVAPHLVVESSLNTSTAYFPDSAAVDGSRDTCWETNSLGPETSLTLRESDSSPVTVASYTLVARNGWAGRAPSAFTLYGSNDKTDWTSTDARTGITDWTGASDSTDVKNFVLASPATYVFWKLVVTATQGGDIVNLGEIYLNDTENAPAPLPSNTVVPYYVRMTGIPRGRIVTLALSGAVATVDWQYQWQAFVTDYPESQSETTGYQYWNPRNNPPSLDGKPYFYGTGKDLILRVGLSAMADFTVTWTSTEAPTPLQPNTWYDRQVVSPVGGSITYNGVPYATGQGRNRYYSFTPTTSDPLTITSNEPYGDWEVYAEDGVRSFDAWMGEGRNLADGTQDPARTLQISPNAGQEYVFVVYANGQPTPEAEWTLTWAQQTFTPPYVVSNDLFANPISLGDLTDGLAHAYDNTGATTDVAELPYGKRSIWYTFQVTADSMVLLTLIPSDTTDVKSPSTTLLSADRTVVANGDTVTSARLVPGLYHLAISFDSALPTSDWEQHGSMSFTVIPTPPHIVDPNFTLQPGNADPGGGQNYHVGPVFPGTTVGAYGTARIVAPSDGGLSLIVEAGSEGGTTLRPDVIVNLLSHRTLRYGYTGYVPVSLDTVPAGYYPAPTDPTYWSDPANPTRMPSRPVGTSSIEPVTFAVKAGDVIEVRIMAAYSGCYIRWGMTTTTKAPSGWVSARFGDYVTHDGTAVPTGLTPEQATELRAGASDWPVDWDFELGNRPGDHYMNPQDADGYVFPDGHRGYNPSGERYEAWTFSNWEYNRTTFQSDRIEMEILETDDFLSTEVNGALVSGDNAGGTVFRQVGDNRKEETWSQFGGRIMHDPADSHTILDLSTNLHMGRQQLYVLRDKLLGDQAAPPEAIRTTGLLSDLRPVWTRAEQGVLDSYRPWAAPGTDGLDRLDAHGQVIRLLTWQVQWDTPSGIVIGSPKEIYNTYRWVDSVQVQRSARRPYDTDSYPILNLEMNPDYPANSIWPQRDVDTVVELYDVPVELTDNSWVSPGMIEGGELVDSWNFPNESVLDANGQLTGTGLVTVSPGPAKHRDYYYLGYASGIGFEDSVWQKDIFNGARPVPGAKFYDSTYASMTKPYRDGYFPFIMSTHALWDRWGYENQAPMGGQFANGSFFYNFECDVNPRTSAGREYPKRFRVALWEPNITAIAPVVPQPAAGSTLTSTQNITGEPGAVAVHFATT